MDDLRRKRQQLLSFLLRQGRLYSGGGHWTLAHRRWLARQAFEHPAQQIVFQDGERAASRDDQRAQGLLFGSSDPAIDEPAKEAFHVASIATCVILASASHADSAKRPCVVVANRANSDRTFRRATISF